MIFSMYSGNDGSHMSEMYGPETIWGFPIHGGTPQIIQSRPRCCKCWRQWPSPPPWHQAQRHVGFLGRCNNFWKKREIYIIYNILYIYIWNSSGFGWVPITVGFRSLCHGPRTKKQPIFEGLCTSTYRCRMVAASLFWDGFDASQVLLPSTGLGNPQAQEVGRFASEEWLG